jgi:PAS domain S-box-containing protein
MNPQETAVLCRLREAVEMLIEGSLVDATEVLWAIDSGGCTPLAELMTSIALLVERFAASSARKETALASLQLSMQELEMIQDELRKEVSQRTHAQAELQAVLQELSVSEARHRALVETTGDWIWEMDANAVYTYSSPQCRKILGFAPEEMIGRTPSDFVPPGDAGVSAIRKFIASRLPITAIESTLVHRDGHRVILETSGVPFFSPDGMLLGYRGIGRDVSERKRLMGELQQTQKMEAVGRLAAGIAHEINTPTQFIGDNTQFLKDAFGSLLGLVGKYKQLQAVFAEKGCDPDLSAEMTTVVSQTDLDYLMREIPKAIDQSIEGLQRVADIVRAMKQFSHPGEAEKKPTDLNQAIATTLTVTRNEWKYVADVETDFDKNLPSVYCFLGDLNQVFLNLIVNAVHAIESTGAKGIIRISTRLDSDHVEIRIADTGIGIAEEHRQRIFEPFFTTKEVGKGTGQGLTLAYQTVVKKHGGTIRFETERGKGTTFVIRLPVKDESEEEARV